MVSADILPKAIENHCFGHLDVADVARRLQCHANICWFCPVDFTICSYNEIWEFLDIYNIKVEYNNREILPSF